MCEPGRRAIVQRHPDGLAERRAPPVHRSDHGRHAVRLIPTGDQSRNGAGRSGRDRRCGRVRRRIDEPHPDRLELVEEAGPRRRDPEGLLRPVRVHVAVRRRRAHRRQVAGQPRRLRPARVRIATARPRCVGCRPIRVANRRHRRSRARRRRPGHRSDHADHPRRGAARDLPGTARRAQAGRPRGRRAHGRLGVADLRWRRSGAPHDRGARGATGADPTGGSSIRAWSGSTRY